MTHPSPCPRCGWTNCACRVEDIPAPQVTRYEVAWVQMNPDNTANVHIVRPPLPSLSRFNLPVRQPAPHTGEGESHP